MNQNTYYVVDSLGVSHPETIDVQPWTLSRFFVEGGMTGMILISLMLIALFLAAWKAPRWVREIGIGALVLSVFLTLMGLFQIFGVTEMFGDISFAVISGGLKVAMIPLFYGLIVYFISLIIRVIQTPRI